MGAFKLNDIEIKTPHEWKVERYTLTNSARTANGDMVMDFVANKRKFTLTYSAITGPDLDTLIDILWTQLKETKKCFATFEYPENGEIKTATVYAGAIPSELHRGGSTKYWVWKNVSISLIEK